MREDPRKVRVRNPVSHMRWEASQVFAAILLVFKDTKDNMFTLNEKTEHISREIAL